MLSNSDIGPISQQYAAAATVPLVKSPSLWLPKPVELPNDIHPLPEDITAYENHVLNLHPSPHEAISQKRAKCAEILHEREEEEEQKERDAIRKIAPGYNPSSVLVPKSSHTPSSSISQTFNQLSSTTQTDPTQTYERSQTKETDAMDDLVARLEEMESNR
ncbi:uncharacterized protein L203_102656 [Cryptococcus depauperatus CBS 7841]|uniref:Uncharacterized protein n=1 Tax=Cryptococcus depauperatus CBS 7841 TaxID=1295531 RepID=A0AAJ8JS91_9TREE